MATRRDRRRGKSEPQGQLAATTTSFGCSAGLSFMDVTKPQLFGVMSFISEMNAQPWLSAGFASQAATSSVTSADKNGRVEWVFSEFSVMIAVCVVRRGAPPVTDSGRRRRVGEAARTLNLCVFFCVLSAAFAWFPWSKKLVAIARTEVNSTDDTITHHRAHRSVEATRCGGDGVTLAPSRRRAVAAMASRSRGHRGLSLRTAPPPPP